jgi:hypothetical protein
MRRVICGLIAAEAVLALLISFAAAADDFKPDEGFTLLFNGKDLTGWKLRKGGASLDGKTEAADGRFKVADGVLGVDVKVKGDVIIDSEKTFAKDVHIKFDFMPGTGCNNDLYLRGMKFDIKKPDVKNFKEGEWNSFEIVVKGNKAEFKCNGETQKTLDSKPAATPLGIRAELGPIQIRRLRVKEAP